MPSDTKGIFISYRREEAAAHAGWLAERLSQHFGEHKVFRDIDSIEPGLDFVDAIQRAVDSSEVVIAVIGKSWLTAADATGRPRLQNPDDYVRREIAAALQRNARVLPVLVQDASMPSADELPDDLALLARRNAVELRDTSWGDDVRRLTNALENVVISGHKGADTTARPLGRHKDETERQARRDHTPQDRGAQTKVLGAIGAALAGVMWVISVVVLSINEQPWTPVTLLAHIATLVALIGIYRYVRQQPGYSGWTTVGFSLVATSNAILIADVVYDMTMDLSMINDSAPPGWVVQLYLIMDSLAPGIGYVLLGITSLRARLLPGWGNVAWFIGGAGAFGIIILYFFTSYEGFGIILFALLAYGVMWLTLGYALWANRSVPAEKN